MSSNDQSYSAHPMGPKIIGIFDPDGELERQLTMEDIVRLYQGEDLQQQPPAQRRRVCLPG